MVGQDIPIYLFGHIDGHLVLRIELFLFFFCETVTDVSMSKQLHVYMQVRSDNVVMVITIYWISVNFKFKILNVTVVPSLCYECVKSVCD